MTVVKQHAAWATKKASRVIGPPLQPAQNRHIKLQLAGMWHLIIARLRSGALKSAPLAQASNAQQPFFLVIREKIFFLRQIAAMRQY
jgi:hypothetical protein